MGGGGFLGLGPAPSAPAAPNYTAAAEATASGNLDAARVATAAKTPSISCPIHTVSSGKGWFIKRTNQSPIYL